MEEFDTDNRNCHPNNLQTEIQKVINFIRESNAKCKQPSDSGETGGKQTEEEDRISEVLRTVLQDCINKCDSTRLEKSEKVPGLKNIYISKSGEQNKLNSSKTFTKVLKIPLMSDLYSIVIVNNYTKHTSIVKHITNYHIQLTEKLRDNL